MILLLFYLHAKDMEELTDRLKECPKPRKDIDEFDKDYYYQYTPFRNYVPLFLCIHKFTYAIPSRGCQRSNGYSRDIIISLLILKGILKQYNNHLISNSDLILTWGLGFDKRSMYNKKWSRLNKIYNRIEMPGAYLKFFDGRLSKRERKEILNGNSFDKWRANILDEDVEKKLRGLIKEMVKFNDDMQYRGSFSRLLRKEIKEQFDKIEIALKQIFDKYSELKKLKTVNGKDFEKGCFKQYIKEGKYVEAFNALICLYPNFVREAFFLESGKGKKSSWENAKLKINLNK